MKTALMLMLTVGNMAMASNSSDRDRDEGFNEIPKTVATIEKTAVVVDQENSSRIFKAYKWLSHSFSDTITEQSKFPNIKISKLSELNKKPDSTWDELIGSKFSYSTGSYEGSPDTYNGEFIIKSINYGTYEHTYHDSQKGFDRNVQYQSLRETMLPYFFFKKWIEERGDTLLFKGVTYTHEGRVCIDYIAHDESLKYFVKVSGLRKPLT